MAHSFDSVPEDDPLIKSTFHHVLIAFAVPGRWPSLFVFLFAGVLALAAAWVWVWRGVAVIDAALVFLILGAFFIADRDLLASLPRRRLSFGSWRSQIFALFLPRVAVTVVLGLIWPHIGWQPAFYLHIAIQIMAWLALYRGAVIEPRELSLSKLPIKSDRLPPRSDALRLLHISDLHIEHLGDREARVLELVSAAKPDVILITGDYVNLSFNSDPLTHQHVRDFLGNLSAPGGVFAVLGSPAVDLPDVIPPLFAGLPIRLLRDEAVALNVPGGQALTLFGVDCSHNLVTDRRRLETVVTSTTGGGPMILLHHSPDLMPEAVDHGIDLYLSGHTHGGQVRLPFVGPVLTSSKLGRRYVMGHYKEGRTNLYVSRGIGFEGLGAPRVRFLCPPEMTLVTIEAA